GCRLSAWSKWSVGGDGADHEPTANSRLPGKMNEANDQGIVRVIIAGGGTGGHLFPGLAVADALGRRGPSRIVFVGSSRGIETRVVSKRGYPLRTLPVRALRGQGLLGLANSALRLPASLLSAWRLLGEIRPDLLIGVGGYASGPVVVAGWSRRIPTVLLEQNAHPGLTNRVLAHFADRICVSFPESMEYFPRSRTVQTGNPVRPPAEPMTGHREGFSVLIFGGSAGAHRLNEIGVEAMARLERSGLRVVHQTGDADLETVRHRYRRQGIEADVRPFIDDMAAAYAAADIVVCRAGATTLAELTALGKPALLVPYPYAADDHQRKNAESLVARGAAMMILDRELSAASLSQAVTALRADPERLATMARAARRLGRPEAVERVVDVCLELIQNRRRRAA
ncbi:MAG TPA: undecaprenyldiphospho-muramoylpentapeptide beta-N-acetylglucosaminyltransferase, partial [Candidatus Binatia bacterium]|nr:undecaprenyldiphospho-muramoylpentapeptide beta-N-acetylglucosaminyltransferase [Candidatus Binatia bacterium]